MTDFHTLSLGDALDALHSRRMTAEQATQACLDRIAATEPVVDALLHVDAEKALARARALDAQGPDTSKPLWGIPVTVKDALSTEGMPTTAGSRILEGFTPIYDAFVVERLKEAGAVILGKNNLDEFAMGSGTENSAYKASRNPWDPQRVPGGSSGGSAASVAAGQCFASLGSDTGGSIRQPAALCGCVGLKPTYGRVSRYGLIAYGSSLDQVGPLARSVEDCARVLSVIAGYDERDTTCAPAPLDDYVDAARNGKSSANLDGVRLGLPREFYGDGLAPEVREACNKAIEAARAAGADIVDVSLPHTHAAIATYYIIAMAEASSNLARFDGVRYGRRAENVENLEELYFRSRSEGFGQEVKRRILFGAYVLSAGYYDAYYLRAQKLRTLIRNEFSRAFESADLLLAPTTPETAFPRGGRTADPLKMYLGDICTVPANLTGLPAVSLPCGFSAAGMPIGLQLIGKALDDGNVLAAAHAFETAHDFSGRVPAATL